MIRAGRPARRVPALVMLAATLLAPGRAQTEPLAHREMLGNGIRLLVAPRPAIPVVAVRAYVRAGSAFDPPEAPGLANLTAELLTRGTARHTGPELDRAIEFVGGTLDADASRDGVTVSLDVLRKDLDLGLDLLAEVLRSPSFPEDELRRQAGEIAGALRQSEENPEVVAGRALTRILYPGHPYAHPVEGTIASVEALTRARVERFYRRHYRPDALTIAVVGDVAVDEVRRALERRLGAWAPPAEPVASVPPAPPDPPIAAETIARDLTQATVYLGRPGVGRESPDYFPLLVANYILGGGSASRLYTRVREERGLAYSVYSSLSPGRYGSAYTVVLQTGVDGAGEATRLVREEMRRMGQGPVEPRALALAKSFLAGSFPLRLDTSRKTANFLIGIEEYGLGLDYPVRFAAGINAVTAADVARVVARYMDPAAFSTVTVTR